MGHVLGPFNWDGSGNNFWGNLERYIGTVSISDDPDLLRGPAWSPWGNVGYDIYHALGTPGRAGLGNNYWGNLGTYFGTTSPYAVTTPTWNMLGEITSWDMLGTSNWAGLNETENLVDDLVQGAEELINEYLGW